MTGRQTLLERAAVGYLARAYGAPLPWSRSVCRSGESGTSSAEAPVAVPPPAKMEAVPAAATSENGGARRRLLLGRPGACSST